MQSASPRIPVRSRRQAMDWSLVLVSQGIETEINCDQHGPGWGLLVPEPDYPRALQVIRQYKIENRRWPWRREVKAGLLFDWTCLAWVLLICFFYWVSATRADLRAAGAVDALAIRQGEIWRLFTAIWLHADLAHLAANASIGFVLMGLALGQYRTGPGLLSALLAGALGNLLAINLDPSPHRSLGASGLIMGCLGLLAVQSFLVWKQPPMARRSFIIGLAAGIMLFVLLGLSPGTDILAHLGGFLAGLLLGTCLALAQNLLHKSWFNFACGALFLLLVIWPWYYALKN